ncbi:MAG: hypothetical protein H6983_23300 [Ectothiorhodospiraceae bacterium]|nr:hypothetical protein [Chromatiales bacterium]MCP5157124.1 hypothetical protein [Ectothiorhodospiraceae bacterium]
MLHTHVIAHGWTEDELVAEIQRLDSMLEARPRSIEPRAKCARAYLRQLRRDRQALLKRMRNERRAMNA